MNQGITLALLTALISGVSIFANGLFVSKTDPLIFALVRNACVAVLFSLLLHRQSSRQNIRELSGKQWGMLSLIGMVGGGIPFALFFTGLSQIGAVNANIIQKTLFLWVALLAVPLLGERIRRVQVLGYALLLIGMFYFGGGVTIIPNIGTWLVLMATIFWSIEQIIAKRALIHISPVIVAWGRMVFGLPLLLIAVVYTGKIHMLAQWTTYALSPLLVSSILLTVYMTAWYRALSKAPAILVSSVLVVAPVVTALLTKFVLHKPFKEGQMASFTLIMVGILFILSEYRMRKRSETA